VWLFQLDLANSGDNVLLNVVAVVLCGAFPDGRLDVVLEPERGPLSYRVVLALCNVNLLIVFYRLFQLLLDLSLSFAEDIPGDPFAGVRVVPGGVPAFPAAIAAFPDIAFAVGAALCHRTSLLSFVATTHTTL